MPIIYTADTERARVRGPAADISVVVTPIGLQLRALRQRANLRQTELADRIGVSQSLVSQVENGKEATTTEVVSRWVDACGGDLIIEGADTASVRSAIAAMEPEDVQLLLRIARSLPSAPKSAKGAMTLAFEQLGSRS
jgi:predicted transcriptional regulator